MTITTETQILHVENGEMGIYIARPETGRAPAMLVLQEAFGVNDHIKDVAQRFAEQGYLAVAPELFHRTAPQGFAGDYADFQSIMPHVQALTTEGTAADVLAAHEWLLRDSQFDKSHVGSIGFCMGGRASFIANAKLPLSAAVSFYGGGIAPDLLDMVKDEHGPMLFFWGGLDQRITPELRRSVADTMTAEGKQFITVDVSDAGHGFFCDARPVYNANAARQAWALTLSFLATYLK